MIQGKSDGATRVTHRPSGESMTITAGLIYRTHRERFSRCVSVIKARIFGKATPAQDTEFVYDLPAGQEYPNDLLRFRKSSQTGEVCK